MSDDNQPALNTDPPRGCSCHPDDRAAYGIEVCPRMQATTDCRIATMEAQIRRLRGEVQERTHERTYHFNVGEQLAARVRDLQSQLARARNVELLRVAIADTTSEPEWCINDPGWIVEPLYARPAPSETASDQVGKPIGAQLFRESVSNSAPALVAPHNSGERMSNGDAALAGAEPSVCDQTRGETGVLGHVNDAFHRALRKYPDAFAALHSFWNDAFATPPTGSSPASAEVREQTIDECVQSAVPLPGGGRSRDFVEGFQSGCMAKRDAVRALGEKRELTTRAELRMSRALVRERWLTEEVLRSALQSNGGWRPWRGVFQRAKDLSEKGLLKEVGVTAMSPHVCYVITPAGEHYLRMLAAETKRRTFVNQQQPK